MNMKSLSLVLFSLLMIISAQAETLNVEQLEAIAKNTAEYKVFKRLEEKFAITAESMLSAKEECKNSKAFAPYFTKECGRARNMTKDAAEAADKMFEAQEVWQSTPEFQAWNKAKIHQQ